MKIALECCLETELLTCFARAGVIVSDRRYSLRIAKWVSLHHAKKQAIATPKHDSAGGFTSVIISSF
jgi:hypothetical protein